MRRAGLVASVVAGALLIVVGAFGLAVWAGYLVAGVLLAAFGLLTDDGSDDASD